MFGYICQANIRLSEAYLWICLEMFIVARDIAPGADRDPMAIKETEDFSFSS